MVPRRCSDYQVNIWGKDNQIAISEIRMSNLLWEVKWPFISILSSLPTIWVIRVVGVRSEAQCVFLDQQHGPEQSIPCATWDSAPSVRQFRSTVGIWQLRFDWGLIGSEWRVVECNTGDLRTCILVGAYKMADHIISLRLQLLGLFRTPLGTIPCRYFVVVQPRVTYSL